jgi:tetratricopeptide (TPR) repeat protein
MKKLLQVAYIFFSTLLLLVIVSCNGKNKTSTNQAINEMGLKHGEVISCGPPDKEFGSVGFETSCSDKVKKDFHLAIALLHSFEYDEAEKVFAKIIDEQPECAMAYWGVAMSNYHPLWTAPTSAELEKGAKAIAIAQSLKQKSKIETDYINAIALFYKDWNTTDHRTRSQNYEKAMEKIYVTNSNNKEAALFYSLALIATADPADKTFANQKKAGNILTALYPDGPNHPGIVHYIIHTYDYPELATLALPAARKYASIAPSSAHAQHMPSHIFTRLGLWDESINSNIAAAASAKCYAETAGMKGHWDEELHSLDYLVYGYLQKGDNDAAKKQWDYLNTIREVEPINFKVLYAFAAVPSRYVLENKMWKEAAGLQIHPANFPWENFPWQKAIIHFTRLLGAAHIGYVDTAKLELENLKIIYDTLVHQNDAYKANQVMIQIKAGEAWIKFGEGKRNEAVRLMTIAADMEDKTEKHPVTPGEVLPAKELLADMLLLLNKPAEALTAYEENLKKHPNRFNALYGAGLAGERTNNIGKAKYYYQQLIAIANSSNANRPELERAKLFLTNKKTVASKVKG